MRAALPNRRDDVFPVSGEVIGQSISEALAELVTGTLWPTSRVAADWLPDNDFSKLTPCPIRGFNGDFSAMYLLILIVGCL